MHFKHIAIPLLYAISTPFAVYKYKIHLFSVLANEPAEIRLIFWLHGGPKNQLCPELLGGCCTLCCCTLQQAAAGTAGLVSPAVLVCCQRARQSNRLLTCNCTYQVYIFPSHLLPDVS